MDERSLFRDKIIAIEPMASEIRQRINEEIRQMMVRKLKLPARIMISVVALVSILSALLCGYLALTEVNLPWMARLGLGTGTLFGLAWFLWTVRIVRSGQMNLAKDTRVAAQMVWVFTVLMTVFFLVLGMTTPDRMLGVLMILQSLAFLIGAAVYWLSYRIEAAELTVKEQLLRMELHFTQLLERHVGP